MLELGRCLWWGVLCFTSGVAVQRSWLDCEVLAIWCVVVVVGAFKIVRCILKLGIDTVNLYCIISVSTDKHGEHCQPKQYTEEPGPLYAVG